MSSLQALRPVKQIKTESLEEQDNRVRERVRPAGHVADAALKKLFAVGEGEHCDAQLDEVLSYAYDDDMISSVLRIAGTRITQWTTDKAAAEYGDEKRRHAIIAQLKQRWAMKLLTHLAENLDDEFNFAGNHLSLTTYEKSERYKMELNVTPIFEIDDDSDAGGWQEILRPERPAPEDYL